SSRRNMDAEQLDVTALTFRLGTLADTPEAAGVFERADARRRGIEPEDASERNLMLWVRLSRQDAWLLLCETEGKVVGTALGSPAHDRDGEGEPLPGVTHLSLVSVDPDYWGRGI